MFVVVWGAAYVVAEYAFEGESNSVTAAVRHDEDSYVLAAVGFGAIPQDL